MSQEKINFSSMLEAILAENVGNKLTGELARGIHSSVLQAVKFCAEQHEKQLELSRKADEHYRDGCDLSNEGSDNAVV